MKKAIDQSIADRMNGMFTADFGPVPDPNDAEAFEDYKAKLLAAGHNRSVMELEASVTDLDDTIGDHIQDSAESKAVKQQRSQNLMKAYTKRDASNRRYKDKNALLIGGALLGLPLLGFLLFASSPKKDAVVVQPGDTAVEGELAPESTDGTEIAGSEIPQAPLPSDNGEDLGSGLDTTAPSSGASGASGVIAQPPELTSGEQSGNADNFLQPTQGLDTTAGGSGTAFVPPEITAPAPQTQRDPEYVSPSPSLTSGAPEPSPSTSGGSSSVPSSSSTQAAKPKSTSSSGAAVKPPVVVVKPPVSDSPFPGLDLGLSSGATPVPTGPSAVGGNPAVDPSVTGGLPSEVGGTGLPDAGGSSAARSGMSVYARSGSRTPAGGSASAGGAATASGSAASNAARPVTAYRAAPKPAAAPTVYIAPPVARPVTVYSPSRPVVSAPPVSRAAVRVGGNSASTGGSSVSPAASSPAPAPAAPVASAAPASAPASSPLASAAAQRSAPASMVVYRRTTAQGGAGASSAANSGTSSLQDGAAPANSAAAAASAARGARPASVIYSRTAAQTQAAAAQGTGVAQQNPASVAAALPTPVPGTTIPGVLTGDVVTALGASVPVIVRAADGNLWIGAAGIDGMKRMQVLFTRMVTPSGQVVPVRAMAFDTSGKAGFDAKIVNKAPNLVNDLLRAAISGVDRYVSTLANSKTVTVAGNTTVQSDNVPTLGQTVLANTSGIFKLPETGSSFVPVGEAAMGTRLFIVVDVTAESAGAGAGASGAQSSAGGLSGGLDTTSR